MSKRKQAYLTYLKSNHWSSLRKQCFSRDGFKCSHCNSSSSLQAHHIRYRKNLRDCSVSDLITICKPCHDALHKEKARLRKLNRKPRLNLSHIILLFSADL